MKLAGNAKRLIRGLEVKDFDDDTRSFTGLAAAYTLDQGGDIIMPGAFKRTLSDWRRSKGKVIPLIDTHDYGSVNSIVGKMIEGKEVDDGLEARFSFIPDDPTAEAVYRRVKGGYVTGLSIGYDTVEYRSPSEDERRKGIWRYLKEVKLREVSTVAFPMNVDAEIDTASVKGLSELARRYGLVGFDPDDMKALHTELGALLEAAHADDTAAPLPEGLAPDSPKRLELEEAYRAVLLRGLGAK